jgi:hypothetical protein
MSEQTPSVGRIVHYVSYGTPGGEYTSECRAAVIAEVILNPPLSACSLVVFSPSGLFFNDSRYDDTEPHQGGTWHWPERV